MRAGRHNRDGILCREGIIENRIIERRIIRRDREIESGIYRARDTKESDNRGWKKRQGKCRERLEIEG